MVRSRNVPRRWSRSALVVVAAIAFAGWYSFVRPKRAAHGFDAAPAANSGSSDAAPARWDPAAFHKPSEADLKNRLTPLQFEVTQEEATEPPFHNQYWDNHRAGIYVDVVSGEPLFSSLDKYDSGTGWPSFSKPLDSANVKTKTDFKLILPRHEVRSAHADSHLGHVFDDGPPPTGQRYCMNSAALRFVPVDQLQAQGYGQYLALFPTTTAAAPSADEVKPAAAAH